jgi:hypothetical protein
MKFWFDTIYTGWGVECIEGAAAAMDAERGLMCVAAVEDQVIVCMLAKYEVGCVKVEL